MKVLFLMISYSDTTESSNIYTDLVDEFNANGHETYVVAPAKKGEKTKLAIEGNSNVLRVKTLPLFNVSPIKKGIANVLLPYQFQRAIKLLEKINFDLIVVPTPPITFASIAQHLKNKCNAKVYLILRDIFPQNAWDLGLIKNKLLYNYFKKKEKLLYQISDHIGCMSAYNIEYLKKHNPTLSHDKLNLLPNWQKVISSNLINHSLKEKYGFKDKYLVIFGGNIGAPQKIENIVDLAVSYNQNNSIIFLIVGKGTHVEFFKDIIKKQKLNNIVIKDSLPRDEYQDLIKTADVGLISLSEKFTIPNIPSKTLSYFNAKIPILAAIDANTDYGKILEEANAGLWSVTGDHENYLKNFDTLYNNKELRVKMGENGYNYMLKYLSSEQAYKNMINHLKK